VPSLARFYTAADLRARGQQALGHQHLDGLAHRRAADVEHLGPFRLVRQHGAGRIVAAHDAQADFVCDSGVNARAAQARRHRQRQVIGQPGRRNPGAFGRVAVATFADAARVGHFDSSRNARKRSNATARMMKLPTKAPCQNVLIPSRIRLFRITSMRAAPTTDPNTVPAPPIRLAPPITEAAITESSIDWPSLVVTPPSHPASRTPAPRAKDAEHMETPTFS